MICICFAFPNRKCIPIRNSQLCGFLFFLKMVFSLSSTRVNVNGFMVVRTLATCFWTTKKEIQGKKFFFAFLDSKPGGCHCQPHFEPHWQGFAFLKNYFLFGCHDVRQSPELTICCRNCPNMARCIMECDFQLFELFSVKEITEIYEK